jgi:hypothetical protein
MGHTLYECLQRLHNLDLDMEAPSFQRDKALANVEDDERPQSDKYEEDKEDTVQLEHTWELPHEDALTEWIEEEGDNDSQEEIQEPEHLDIGTCHAAEHLSLVRAMVSNQQSCIAIWTNTLLLLLNAWGYWRQELLCHCE